MCTLHVGVPTLRIVRAVGVALAMVLAASATALPPDQPQPERQPAGVTKARDEQPRDGAKNHPIAREALRKRIERRLGDAKEAQKKLEEAIKAMDGGASMDDLKKLLPEQGGLRGLMNDQEPDDGPGMREPGDGPPPGAGLPGRFGRRDGMRDGDAKQGEPRAMTDEDRAAMREVLLSAAPELAKKIDELAIKDPEAAKKKILEVFPRMRGMLELREKDPKSYKLRLEDLTLARQSIPLAKELLDRRHKGESPDSVQAKATTASLRAIMVKQFENRMLGVQYEIDAMQARIEEKRKQLATMKTDQNEAVDRIMESLIKRADKPGLEKELLGPGRGGPGGAGRPDGPDHPNHGDGRPPAPSHDEPDLK